MPLTFFQIMQIELKDTYNAYPPKILIHGGEKVGKALAINTLIPTPDGWKELKDIKTGDKVFDKTGNIVNVTNVTPVIKNRNCYEVKFKDGSSLIADEDHQWDVLHIKLNRSLVRTTDELQYDLQPPKLDRYNYSVPVACALNTPDLKVPVDPYTLGVWLGDGTSANNTITIADRDKSIVDNLDHLGARNPKCNCHTYTLEGLKPIMEKLSLLNNKHIPLLYFRSSLNQRIELFRGLMDTDGYIADNGKGTCEFVSVSKQLAEDFLHLLKTIGIKAKILQGEATINGRYICEKYRVYFFSEINPFTVKFKSDRFKAKTSKRKENKNAIVSITPVESVAVKCIEVDSPSHTYLAGESYTVTHNSTFAAGAPGAIFLPTEEGLKGLHSKSLVVKGKSRLETLEEYEFMLSYCEQNPNTFQTLITDSADWLEQLIVEWLCKKYNKSNVAECAGGFGKGYLVLMNKWNEILQRLDRINRMGKFIIITCHSKAVLFNDPMGEPYDLWTMKLYSPKGQNGSLELLKEWVDVIGFAMVEKFTNETDTTKALEKGEKKHRARETGKRLLQYETSQAFLAGNRYGIKNPTELNWSGFMTALIETQTKTQTR